MCRTVLYCFFFLLNVTVFSQKQYNINALTGNGDIELKGTSFKLQKEAYNAFQKMKNAALKEGITIKVVSAYRSFGRQKSIWNRKYKLFVSQGLIPQDAISKIIEYSTLPGTSRHHWGTDIDIIDASVKAPNSLLMERNYDVNGAFFKLKNWMDANSEAYGFYLVYTQNTNRKGFKYEPWHYTYKPISKPMLKEFKKVDLVQFYKKIKLNGNQYLTNEFLTKYTQENILDINSSLLKD